MKLVSPIYFRDKYIQIIIDNFNWERVHLAMKLLDWEWAILGRVPTINEIKIEAIKYLKEAYDGCLRNKPKNGYAVGSGGFMAEAFYDEELKKNVYLELRFVLEDWFIDKEAIELINKNKYDSNEVNWQNGI